MDIPGKLSVKILPPGATEEMMLPSGPTIVVLELGPSNTPPTGARMPALATATKATKATSVWNLQLFI